MCDGSGLIDVLTDDGPEPSACLGCAACRAQAGAAAPHVVR